MHSLGHLHVGFQPAERRPDRGPRMTLSVAQLQLASSLMNCTRHEAQPGSAQAGHGVFHAGKQDLTSVCFCFCVGEGARCFFVLLLWVFVCSCCVLCFWSVLLSFLGGEGGKKEKTF